MVHFYTFCTCVSFLLLWFEKWVLLGIYILPGISNHPKWSVSQYESRNVNEYGKGQSVQLLWVKLSKKESFLILVIFWAGVWWSIFLVWATITIWGLGDLYFTGDLYFWVFSYGSLDWARWRCGSGSRIAGIHDCSYFRVQNIACTRGTILYDILRHWGGTKWMEL